MEQLPHVSTNGMEFEIRACVHTAVGVSTNAGCKGKFSQKGPSSIFFLIKQLNIACRKIQSTVHILQSHLIITMSHWSSWLPVCFPSQGTQVQVPRGDLCETGILLLAMSPTVQNNLVLYEKQYKIAPNSKRAGRNIFLCYDVTVLFSHFCGCANILSRRPLYTKRWYFAQ
jgi:hypothetical protein